jgi:hypothetical protein
MTEHLQFRAVVEPEKAEELLEIRGEAIAEAQSVCPALVRAELVRLDERTWLDVLVWSAVDGADQLMARAAELPLLGRMHGLIGEVLSVDLGQLAHSTER